MTKKQLRKYSNQIITLYKSPPAIRKYLLKNAPDGLIRILSESALNLLKRNIPLTKKEKMKLKRHKNKIRQLASNKNISFKKNLMLRGGNWLRHILSPIVSFIAQML